MSDPNGLEGRLRAALGGEDLSERNGARSVAGLDAARARVVAGVRHRRLRRLQVAGSAAVVVLGLALSLPQVLGGSGGSAPRGAQAGAVHPKSSAPTFAPARHAAANAGPGRASRPTAVAVCHLKARTVHVCGTLETGAAARALGATVTSAGQPGALGTSRSAKGLGSPLVVRVGTRIVVDLPVARDGWRWATPQLVGTPVSHGRGPPVTVRPRSSSGATRTGAAQAFVVTTHAPLTVVLEAEDDVFSGPGAAPPSVDAGPEPVWVLELEVE